MWLKFNPHKYWFAYIKQELLENASLNVLQITSKALFVSAYFAFGKWTTLSLSCICFAYQVFDKVSFKLLSTKAVLFLKISVPLVTSNSTIMDLTPPLLIIVQFSLYPRFILNKNKANNSFLILKCFTLIRNSYEKKKKITTVMDKKQGKTEKLNSKYN